VRFGRSGICEMSTIEQALSVMLADAG